MSEGSGLAEMVRRGRAQGLAAVEVYHKQGRGRRFTAVGSCSDVQFLTEEGWAIRGGGREGSFFEAGSGAAHTPACWPEPAGAPLRLPPARPLPRSWHDPSDLDASLLSEREGLSLLEGVREALREELPEASLERAVLEDGSSVSRLVSSEGVDRRWRHRVAALHLEASHEESGARVELYVAEREGRRLRPSALGRSLADRLLVASRGTAPERERGACLLAPLVGARLLHTLRPLWLGPDAPALARALQDRSGCLGSPLFHLVDDARLAHGVLTAPVDGEGVPTDELTLIAEGRFRRPLLPWWLGPEEGSGCARRPGWRDLPEPGPSHLYLRPQPRVLPSSLVAAIDRGFYLMEAGPGQLDLRQERFALPVGGFVVRDGVARSPVSGAWLSASLPRLLHGLQAVARDLSFFPLGGMIGSPTLLVTDLELRGGV